NEAILYSVNRLIEAFGDDVGLSMLLVDFKNAFNLVDREVMLRKVHLRCPTMSRWVEFCYSNPARLYYEEHTLWSCQGVQQGDLLGPLLFSLVLHPLICKIRNSFSLSLHAWYLDDGTIVGDTMVVGKVLELIMEDGSWCGLHLNVDKTKVFCPKEDPRSRLAGIFPPNIARPLHGVKLLSGPASVDFDFCNELVMKRVAKTIRLMDAIAKINDRQFKLLLLRSCTAGKEVDIWLDVGRDKPLRSADMLLYSWDGGLDVCVDLTRPSLLTRTGMVWLLDMRFLPHFFSSLGGIWLESQVTTSEVHLKSFSITQDI
ncbi:putative reverse transcriptase domain-containing protein, partial [Tanacetum coccineum]